MLGKLCEEKNQKDWSKILDRAEFALNNTASSTTGIAPSMLLFGVLQRGPIIDEISEELSDKKTHKQADVNVLREKASMAIQMSQEKSVEYHNKRFASADEFKVGDFVVVRFFDTAIGTSKKLSQKYRGPYVVCEVLAHDRYKIKDIENCQLTRIPYEGVVEAFRMKHWIKLPASDCPLNNNNNNNALKNDCHSTLP